MLPQVTWIFLPSKHAFWRCHFFADLHVKTVKYFKSIERVQDEVEKTHAELKIKGLSSAKQQVGSMEWLTSLIMWTASTCCTILVAPLPNCCVRYQHSGSITKQARLWGNLVMRDGAITMTPSELRINGSSPLCERADGRTFFTTVSGLANWSL